MIRLSKKTALINISLIILMLIGVYFFTDFARENEQVRGFVASHGYWGIFVIAVMSGFNFLVPIPAIAFLPIIVSAGLSFWTGVVLVSAGMTLGDVIGFVLGRASRRVVGEKRLPRFMKKWESFICKHPKMTPVVLFLYAAFVPLPNEILVIPFSFLGRHWSHTILPVLVGNFVFNTLAAFGLMSIPGF